MYAREVFDTLSWNAVIAAFADSGDANKAIDLFCQMMHIGLIPNSVTFISLLALEDRCDTCGCKFIAKHVYEVFKFI